MYASFDSNTLLDSSFTNSSIAFHLHPRSHLLSLNYDVVLMDGISLKMNLQPAAAQWREAGSQYLNAQRCWPLGAASGAKHLSGNADPLHSYTYCKS